MIGNDQIQSAWITETKSKANITALVPAVEVREDLWKGEKFSYPNVRVKLGELTPVNRNPDCNTFRQVASLLVFIEQKSSKQADQIARVIATEYIGKSFTENGIRVYSITLESLVPAHVPEEDTNSWLAIANLNTLVSPA
jgi:hypothetical protein